MMNTDEGIKWIINKLRTDQTPKGSWSYPFETGITTDAYMIILLRTLGINDEELIQGLVKRIISKQQQNGAWKLFYDEDDGNLTPTLEAYYALLYSGYYKKNDSRLVAAKKFILSNGGVENTNIFTKMLLAITGQYEWPSFSPFPVELILLPPSFPINFYQISVFGRSNIAPIMILAAKKYSKKTKNSPDLSDLLSQRESHTSWERSPEWISILSFIEKEIKKLSEIPEQLHVKAIERAKTYMLERIEPDGTLYSYFSSTFLMIFALLALGYSKHDPHITRAVEGLKSMKTDIDGLPHMQYTTADVWNTSLISYALQNAGVSSDSPVIKQANHYLRTRQHYKFGDWVIHNPDSLPGGWGFSDIDTINPDVDDTTASLRAIARNVSSDSHDHEAWNRGLHWVISMQNHDGGWPAFEKNVNDKWIKLVPIEKGEFLLGDPSSADLTGRTLEFFGNYTNLSSSHSIIQKGSKWVLKHQENDGSWYGRWGICYLYGTWASITGLIAAGLPASHSSIEQSITWIKSIQNHDGGWGESCRSDIQKTYIPLGTSTVTHTAWALDALIAAADKPTEEIQKGMTYLLTNLNKKDWTTDYPKGQGMAGGFYIHYHSYQYVFPLLTLANYQRKFINIAKKQ
ncbi:squalene--hopene cyclase [Heyndrickxia ginsengihumi]|uniref:squalene--hopene cyclase n=1 Tax=Heyndrickxia ginsengihumi TaxID=363870 RepID=UPI00046F2244|nr:squalene--hopene cyclase [Heyndrickxia ginsengihumi]